MNPPSAPRSPTIAAKCIACLRALSLNASSPHTASTPPTIAGISAVGLTFPSSPGVAFAYPTTPTTISRTAVISVGTAIGVVSLKLRARRRLAANRSFPLDRRGRLAADVEHHPVNALHLVDDRRRDPRQQRLG